VEGEGLDRDAREEHLAAGGLGLEPLDQVEGASAKVDVGPAQPEQLALAHPGGDHQDVERFEPVALDGLEEGAGLVG